MPANAMTGHACADPRAAGRRPAPVAHALAGTHAQRAFVPTVAGPCRARGSARGEVFVRSAVESGAQRVLRARVPAAARFCFNPHGQRSAQHRQHRGPTTSRTLTTLRSTDADSSAGSAADPDGQLTTVKLRKPLGVVFAQAPDRPGVVVVEQVTPGGNADASGRVVAGDVLVGCSAVVLKAGKDGQYEAEGYGQRPYDNWETVMFDCNGQDFKTVMSALRSNNERWGINTITLVLARAG